jgi:hypothetical protein
VSESLERRKVMKQQLMSRVSTGVKATVAGGGATTLTGYLALFLEAKWGVPLEWSIPVIGLVGALVARWAGRLLPDAPAPEIRE